MDAATVRDTYRRMINDLGQLVTFRRYTSQGTNPSKTDKEIRARVTGYTADELVGGVIQGDKKVIALYDDLSAAAFPLPVKASDKIVFDGKEHAIIAPDGSTRNVRGTLIAYEFTARG